MRWKEPKDGDVAVKKKFAILPIEIKGETRWLEWVIVKYQYHTCKRVSEDCVISGWFPEEFVDNENEGNKRIQRKVDIHEKSGH